MINQLFCHGINNLQNKLPLRIVLARGAKWSCIAKNHCHVIAVLMRIFMNKSRNPKLIFALLLTFVIHLIRLFFYIITKPSGCKDPCKVK